MSTLGTGNGSIFKSISPCVALSELYSKLKVGGEAGIYFTFSFISTFTSTVSPAIAKQQYDSIPSELKDVRSESRRFL